jgi:disulfide bond formation protein DsbB
MPHYFNRYAPFVLALAAAVSLAAAYVAQYGFGLAPCRLCLWQRLPFALVVGLGFVAWLKPAWRSYVLGAITLTFAAGAALAFFHVGVEQKWWQMPGECGGVPFKSGMSPADFAALIKNTKIARCDQPAWQLGPFITMASLNVLWSGALVVLALLGLKKGRV